MKKMSDPLEYLLGELADIERFGWPPECSGALYQPERPFEKGNANNPSIPNQHAKD